MLATDPTGNSVPNFETIKFMSDHTNGYRTGQPTPVNHVADNDYGVAELVQAVSNSPIWNSTAIFIVEDDAQDGPDHVDCHRSTCYVISPLVHPNTVDHGFHNTDSVLHSIELLLNIPPLSQYDAYAPSFGTDFDSTTTNGPPYTALAETPANATQTASAAFLKAHPAYKKLVAMTAKMDFSKEDLAPAQLLNEVIWKSVKGMNSADARPAPRRHRRQVRQGHKPAVKGAKRRRQRLERQSQAPAPRLRRGGTRSTTKEHDMQKPNTSTVAALLTVAAAGSALAETGTITAAPRALPRRRLRGHRPGRARKAPAQPGLPGRRGQRQRHRSSPSASLTSTATASPRSPTPTSTRRSSTSSTPTSSWA